ncbi:WD40 repeat domain-containing protein [Speluncibacter jeojiensis]|uniref:WD40 repeat domain-containing protein n=1 Tax=Speluncibacter jeojiensis TaxID=2710754 RepID=A0A9X4M327_9ACTN|nr:WD40 repeat domain-containing protein [Corynebacteriales bacterium D3-21]
MSQARDEALPGARQLFADRFALLYTAAGNLPLRRAADAANERMRATRGPGAAPVATAQRISDWRGGRNVPARFESLLPVLLMLVDRARKEHPEPPAPGLYDVHGWQQLWSDALASSTSAAPAADEAVENASPYLGLDSYRQDDAGLFFGRQRAVDALLARLGSAARSGGMVIVVGASGAGKSSLLQAGLIPSLVRGDLAVDGSADWPVVLIAPGAHPLATLAARIPGIDGAGSPEDAAAKAVAAMTAATGARQVAVIVDQFEEVFTLCRSAVERRRFLAALRAICTATTPDGPPPGVVVIGVRADFYARCLDHPDLEEALQDRGLVLGAMRSGELREAITGPAKSAGLKLEPGLEDVLVHDLRGMGRSDGATETGGGEGDHDGSDAPAGPDAYEPGALPLLSHVLRATWQRRQKGRLTIAGYREAGGVRGSVAATAEQAWDTLDPAAREAARHLLLRLVRIGDDTRDTRRSATRSDLIGGAANPASTEAALEALAGARLLTLDADSVELTHEVVIDAWPRLRAWIDEDRAGNLVRQRLAADAQEWDRHGRDPAGLYRGTRLDAALERTADGQLDHNATAVDLLTESVRHRRRGIQTRRALIGAVVVLAIVAVVGAVLAKVQSTTANHQRDDAVFRQVIAEADRLRTGDPSLSAQLDLVAHRLRPGDSGVYTRLLSTQNTPLSTPLAGHKGAVYLVTYSPDDRLLASASYDGTIRLWNVADPGDPSPMGEPIRVSDTWLTSVAFSPDGKIIAGADGDGVVRLWSIADPRHPVPLGAPLTGSHGAVYVVAFSPDGRTLAAPSDDHTIQLWDVADPAHATPLGPPLTGPTAAIRTVAFSPDGHLLAAGSDDTLVRLWDVTDAARPAPLGAPLGGFRGVAHSVAFSPNSKILAAGSDDSTARLWDVSDPAAPAPIGQPLKAHTAAIWSVTFSPDGNTLATGSWDGTARLWDISEPGRPVLLGQPLAGSSGGIVTVAFSPDGRSLATGGQDAMVRLWNLPPAVIGGHTARITPPAFSADGKLMATGSYDESIRLWSLAGGRPVTVARWFPDKQGANQAGWQVALSGNGRLLAAANSNGGHVQLWDTTDPAHPVPAGQPLDLRTRYTDQLAFSPDGRILATGSDDRNIQLWDVADPQHPTPLGAQLTGSTAWVNAFVFSPDGRIIAGASSDDKVYLWNASDAVGGAPIAELTGHTGPVDAVAFSPDGHSLASAGDDQTIRLWDVRDPHRPTPLSGPIDGHTSTIRSLSFAPSGRTLASGADDQTVRLWNVTDPRRPEAIGDSFADRGVVRWQVAFDPAGHYLAATGEGGVLRLWSLDEEDAVNRICADTHGILTPQVWDEHLPDLLGFDPPCR